MGLHNLGDGKKLVGKIQGQRRGMLPTYSHDFRVALGTDWGKELLVTALAVNVALLLHEAHVRQGGLAVGAVELLRVPRTAHGYQKGAPGEAENSPKLETRYFRTSKIFML